MPEMNVLRIVAATWRRAPGELVLSTIVIAVGIWLCLAAVSARRSIAKWMPPYASYGRLVAVRGLANGEPFSEQFDPARLDRLRREWSQVSSVAGYSERDAILTDGGNLRNIDVALVLGDLPGVLGMAIQAGRSCGWDGNDGEVVLTHALALRSGSGVGDPVTLDGRTRRVIGIIADGPGFPTQSTVLWICGSRLPTTTKTGDVVRVAVTRFWTVARLQPTAGLSSAQIEVASLLGAPDLIVQEFGGATRQTLEPLARASSILAIMILIASVSAVTLMAIAKAAGSGAVWRTHLILGATTPQLLRLVCIEVSTPAVLGGLAAEVAFALSAPLLVAAVRGVARVELSFSLWGSAAMALTLVVIISIVAGLVPLILARRSAHRSLDRSVGQTLTRRPIGLMLAGQAAIAGAFFAIASGLGGAVFHVWTVNRGFVIEHRAAARMDLSSDPSGESRVERLWALLGAVGQPSQVEAAAIDRLPLAFKGTPFDLAFRRADPSGVSYDNGAPTRIALVTPKFFDVVGAHFASGRACSLQEADASAPIVVVNDILFRRESRVSTGSFDVRVLGKNLRVVGVVENLRESGLADMPEPTAYFCIGRFGPPSVMRADGLKKVEIVARATDPSIDLTHWLHEHLAQFSRTVSIDDVASLRTRLARSVGPLNLLAAVFASLAVLSGFVLIVASIALARIMLVRQRREIGVRLAIGATPWQLTRSFSGPSAVWALGGAAVGSAIGVAAFQVVRSEIPGMSGLHTSAVAIATISVVVFSLLGGLVLVLQMARSPIRKLIDS